MRESHPSISEDPIRVDEGKKRPQPILTADEWFKIRQNRTASSRKMRKEGVLSDEEIEQRLDIEQEVAERLMALDRDATREQVGEGRHIEEQEVIEQRDIPSSVAQRFVHRLVELGRSAFRGLEKSETVLRDDVERSLRVEFQDPPNSPFFNAIKEHPWIKKGVLPIVGALSILIMSDIARANPSFPDVSDTSRKEGKDIDNVKGRLRVELDRKIEKGERLPVVYQTSDASVAMTGVSGERKEGIVFRTPTSEMQYYVPPVAFEGLFEGWTQEQLYKTLHRERDFFERFDERGAEDFLAGLRDMRGELSQDEKLYHLSRLGYFLERNYDTAGGSSGAIPIERMVGNMIYAARSGGVRPAGQCRQISLTMGRMAAELGFQSFVTDLDTRREDGHAVAGITLNDGEIVFLDYDAIIPSGTSNLRDASRVLEMYYGATQMRYIAFNKEGKPRSVYFTRAAEDLRSAGRMLKGIELVQSPLTIGVDHEVPVDVYVSQERSEVTVNKEGSFLGVVHFDRTRDPINALQTMNALRIGHRSSQKDEGGRANVDVAMTYIAARYKDPYDLRRDGSETQNLLINAAFASVYERHLSRAVKSETLASMQVAAQYNITGAHLTDLSIGYGVGERLSYIDPRSPRSFFIEGGASFETVPPDVQEAKKRLFEAGVDTTSYAKAGIIIPVREARFSTETVLEAGYHQRKLQVKPEIIVGKWKASGLLEQEGGEERFKTNKEKIRLSLEKQGIRIGDLHGAITIYGAREDRGRGQKQLEFGAQLTILF